MRIFLQTIVLIVLCNNGFTQTYVKGEYIATKGKPVPKFAFLFTSDNSKGMQAKIENGKFGIELPAQKNKEFSYGSIYFSSKVPFGMQEERIKEKRHIFVVENGVVSVTYNNEKNYFVAKGEMLNEHRNKINAIDSTRLAEYKATDANLTTINQKAAQAEIELLKKYPKSPIYQSFFGINIQFLPQDTSSYNEINTLYQSLPDKFKESKYGKNALREIERLRITIKNKTAMVGINPTSLPLTKEDMTVVNLFPNSYKIVLLDFWATWCGPCKKAQPRLSELQKKYSSKSFSVIGIAMDKQTSVWSRYLKGKKNTYPQFWTDPEKAKKHPILGQVQKVPTLVLVDTQTLKILKWDVNLDDVEMEIKRILNE